MLQFMLAPDRTSATAGSHWDEDDVAMATRNTAGVPQDAYSPSAVSPVHSEGLSK